MSYTPVNYVVATAPPLTTIQEHLAGIDTVLATSAPSNLGWGGQTGTTGDVTNSNGNAATLTSSTALLAGLHSAADKVKSDFLTLTGAVNLDTVNTQQGNLITLSGVAAAATDLGAFTGTTISATPTIKTALQDLETALEAITGSTNLNYVAAPGNGQVTSSTGTAATITPVDTTNAGLMLPAEFAKVNFLTVTAATDLDAMRADVADLTTLTGQASNAQDLGVGFAGNTIPDNTTITGALAALETAVEAVPTRIQTVVGTIAARDAQTGVAAGDLTWVTDASADGTVVSGGALYIHDGGGYVKVAEAESLDVVTDLSIGTVDATSVEVVSSSGLNAILPAATNAAAGVATAAQILNLENLITLSGLAADSQNFGALITGTAGLVSDNATLLQALIDIENGLAMQAVTQANLLSAAHASNASNKYAGQKVRVTDRGGPQGLVAFASGGAGTDPWLSSDGLTVFTPV